MQLFLRLRNVYDFRAWEKEWVSHTIGRQYLPGCVKVSSAVFTNYACLINVPGPTHCRIRVPHRLGCAVLTMEDCIIADAICTDLQETIKACAGISGSSDG